MTGIYESDVEAAALGWLEALGYQTIHGPDVSIGTFPSPRFLPRLWRD